MWNAWALWVFVLPYASNFIMETENDSIQRQLYDSSIIDDLGVRDPPLAFLFAMQNITKKIKI